MKKMLLSVVVLAGSAIWQIFAQGLATGFAISESHVLTAYEVVGTERMVQVKFGDEDWMRADCVDGNSDEGWCLLQIQGKAPSFVIVEDEKESQSGDEVYVFGAENGEHSHDRISFFDGDVVNVEKDSRRGAAIRHSVKLNASAIGAALFSEEDNHAIGLIVGAQGHPTCMSQKAIALYGNIPKIRQYAGRRDKTTRKTLASHSFTAFPNGMLMIRRVKTQWRQLKEKKDRARVSFAKWMVKNISLQIGMLHVRGGG